MMFGYARVSTNDQKLDRQIDKLIDHGVHRANIYQEKITGTKRNRPELDRLLEDLEKGDIVIISELTRLGRSTRDLLRISEQLRDKGVELISLKENIDTTTATGKAMFGMLSVMAQFERDLISERTHEGLRSARARGRVGGRPSLPQEEIDRALVLYEGKDFSINDICIMVGISKPTLYKYVNQSKEESL